MLERDFQPRLKEEIERALPGCVIFKQDPLTTHNGIPDLLILWGERWAMLEVKREKKAGRRFEPNQSYWVDHYGKMSFTAVVDRDNYLEVINALQSALGA